MARDVILKPSLTIKQQLKLLEDKGLIIDEIDEASQFLSSNNYYRLNVYFHKLMDSKDHFIPGTIFSDIIKIYRNDSYLRQQIFTMLEPIEIDFKSKVAYYLGNTYGSNMFYKKEIYKSSWKFEQTANTFWREISRNDNDAVVLHHYNNYSGYFPIWVIVEYLSFNAVSKYFSNLKESDQKSIAKNGFGINEYFLGNWIHSLSVMRNICAHYGYLFKREYTVPISFGRDSKKYINQGNGLCGIFYCIKKLSTAEKWNEFLTEIFKKTGKDILINHYNFPPDLSILIK